MRNLALASLLFIGSLFSLGALAGTTSYTLDPEHTQVRFTWSHLGFSTPGATFNDVQGEILADQEHPEKSSANVTISVASIDTGVPLLNEHLLNQPENFFKAKQFPSITFKSTGLLDIDRKDREFKLAGILTINGISKPVVLDTEINKIGAHPMWKNAAAIGLDAKTTLKRSDFGITAFLPAVSDSLKVRITVEAIETSAYQAILKAR